MTYRKIPSVLFIAFLGFPAIAPASQIITDDTIQNGGTLTVNPSGTLIVDSNNFPLLTLTNGAVANLASGVEAVVIGNTDGEGGALRIEGGSILSSSGVAFGQITDPYNITKGYGYLGRLEGSEGVATVTGPGSAWHNESYLYMGDAGSGALRIENGGTVTSERGLLGIVASGLGRATVTGANSTWTNSDLLIVGQYGDGSLSIENGGSVTSSFVSYIGEMDGSMGRVSVTGTGSTWTHDASLFLGGRFSLPNADTGTTTGTGTLLIGNGGEVSVAETTRVYAGGKVTLQTGGLLDTGAFDVRGGELQYEGGELRVSDGAFTQDPGELIISGSEGTQLTLSNGATANPASGVERIRVGNLTGEFGKLLIESGSSVAFEGILESFLGYQSGSTGEMTVTGAGSSMSTAGTFFVGLNGTGKMTVADGATVFTGRTGWIGTFAGSTGEVLVTGAGSSWEVDGLLELNRGTLTVANSGEVRVTGLTDNGITNILSGSSLILETGGALETQFLLVRNGGDILLNGGELRVTDPEINMFIANGATVSGNGTIQGNIQNSGMIAPGMSPGVLSITGDYLQTSTGLLDMEIYGPLVGTEYDVLRGTGTATLGGTITITLNSFNPSASDSFQILDFANIIDNGFTFDFTAAQLQNGLAWDTSQFTDNGTLFISGGTLLGAIPEPGTPALIVLSGLLLVFHRRSRS